MSEGCHDPDAGIAGINAMQEALIERDDAVTVIAEISARAVRDNTRAVMPTAEVVPMMRQMAKDRATLLAILNEVVKLPDEWDEHSFDNPDAVSFMDASQCATELRAILEQKP
jgi:hypothetical protein